MDYGLLANQARSLAEAAKWYEKAALAGHQNALQVYRVLNPQ